MDPESGNPPGFGGAVGTSASYPGKEPRFHFRQLYITANNGELVIELEMTGTRTLPIENADVGDEGQFQLKLTSRKKQSGNDKGECVTKEDDEKLVFVPKSWKASKPTGLWKWKRETALYFLIEKVTIPKAKRGHDYKVEGTLTESDDEWILPEFELRCDPSGALKPYTGLETEIGVCLDR